MTHHQTIGRLVEGLALPPDGIDLRAELAELQAARLRQALEQASGDYAGAARLLRMTRLDLVRLEHRLASPAPATPEPPVDASNVGRIAGGVEVISASLIRRYAAEGKTEKWIAGRLGCNVFVVEKVLRAQTENRIAELDGEGLTPNEIAERMKLPRSRVRRVLREASERRRTTELAHSASANQHEKGD